MASARFAIAPVAALGAATGSAVLFRYGFVDRQRRVIQSAFRLYLAPDLVKASIEGRLPRGIGVARLCDCPAEWSRQYRILGLPSP